MDILQDDMVKNRNFNSSSYDQIIEDIHLEAKKFMEYNHYERIWEAFDKVWKLCIVDNESLEKVAFHCLIGVVNKMCFIFGGKEHSTRVHPMICQSSGTGKSEIMDLLCEILKETKVYNPTKLSCEETYVKKLTKATEAGLTMVESKNALVPGELSKADFICYDEGRVLLSKNPNYEDVRLTFNMVMNETGSGSGKITKVLRQGSVDYTSRTTLMIGSVFDNRFLEIIGEGFLERCFLVIQDFSEEEILEMNGKVLGLSQVDKKDRDSAIENLCRCILEWQICCDFKYRRSSESKNLTYIRATSDSSKKLKDLLHKYWDEDIKDTYNGEKQKILMTFYTRIRPKLFSIATQKALLELKDEVDMKDFEYAMGVCKINMESVVKLLNMQPIKTIQQQNTMESLLEYIYNFPEGLTMEQIIRQTKEWKKAGKWDLGETYTKRGIKQFVEEGKIIEEEIDTGKAGNRPYLYKKPVKEMN